MALHLFKWLLPAFFLLSGPGLPAPAAPVPPPAHPFYATVTEINHNAREHTLEISCKVFADDLEKILEKIHQTPVDIYQPKDPARLDSFIHGYISKHLQLRLDGKPVALQYLGHETEEQSAWAYLQVPGVAAPKKVEIFNDLFYESYNTEINIMHVSVGGIRKSTKLDYPDTQTSLEF